MAKVRDFVLCGPSEVDAVQGSVWKTGRAGPGQEGVSGPPTISAQTPYSSPNFEPTNCCTNYQKTTAYPEPPPQKSIFLQAKLPR